MSSSLPAGIPFHWLLPLLSSVVYVAAALLLKRAADLGADMWRTARVCNFATAILFASLLWLGGTIPPWRLFWQPAVVALLFVAGQVFTLLALQSGDVSVATPVLGVKILLVALFTAALTGERLSTGLWIAAGLSSAAIGLLHVSRGHSHHRIGATVLLAVTAATAYALFDVLVQKWSPAWGAGRFLPVMMTLAAVYSMALRPAKQAPESPASRWVLAGAFCLALQAVMLVSSIAVYRHATEANVLYSSRGLWSVAAVWLVGHWFANRERHLGTRVLVARLAGAALLMAAIVIVLLDGRGSANAAELHPRRL